MEKYVNFGCVSLGKSEKISLIQDRLDHSASKEPMEKDSSVPLMHRDPNDLGSMICFRIFPKKRTGS